ncbi:MAG: elongation factor P maturation arginine rhamnosyltransferase EarP [Hylemonella sp.]|nr:elongation factor P maturation arginine rhamnosyltransferase EarP [Hylemonella sp.]MDH5707921.1 elongation factor P maturation arginine rhamnosyltransferase EarP [Hylemonella sp.]
MTSAMPWDIFCKVIDNHGDLGVCWRLARQLAARGQAVRLWVDDASALHWMAPHGCPGVQVLPWTPRLDLDELPPGDVLIEAFGCEIPPEFVTCFVQWRQRDARAPVWINLEYLSAESYVERSHGLPSPVMHGPGAGLLKHFFYPGFTDRTGGLLREPGLLQRQAAFARHDWLQQLGITADPADLLVSLFCYEPPALPELLSRLAALERPVQLLVTAGRAAAAVRAMPRPAALQLHFLPYLSQDDYDHLLWACELNFVRGEDSLVRALWAGRPFVWHIYPQHDNAHHDKLEAFLATMEAPATWQAFERTWNDVDSQPLAVPQPQAWAEFTRQAQARFLPQADLLTRLLEFVETVRNCGSISPKNR